MQSENKVVDDVAKLTTGALGVLSGMRDEVEAAMRARFDRWLVGLDLVRRDEFEAVKTMAAKARAENEALAARLDALESKPAPRKPRSPRKSAGTSDK